MLRVHLKFNRGLFRILLLTGIVLVTSAPAYSESHTALDTSGVAGPFSIDIGAMLQGDYRYYAESERADNRFDIRRARLIADGSLYEWLRFEIEYELQDNQSSNLLDAYIATDMNGHALVAGQFKEPYSLEWQTPNHSLYFAERSFGYYLSPHRDIGVMLTGRLFEGALIYSGGLFNGDGIGAERQRKEHDDPEIAARLVFQPFYGRDYFLGNLSIGASATYARIDTPNLNLNVKTTGMAESNRSIYVLTHNTKFGVIQDVDRRERWGADAAWSYGPAAVFGEYFKFHYRGLVPVGSAERDADLSAWYAALVFCTTGEPVGIKNGRMQPLVPTRPFNPSMNAWGAFCIAARYEEFEGDADWINPAAFVSVRHAEAFSIAADWILTRHFRLLLDFTHTRLSDPIRVRVLPDGSVDYIDEENVLTLRFSMAI